MDLRTFQGFTPPLALMEWGLVTPVTLEKELVGTGNGWMDG